MLRLRNRDLLTVLAIGFVESLGAGLNAQTSTGFVAVAPCRMVDTRKNTLQGYPAPYGIPGFGTGEQRTVRIDGAIATSNPCANVIPTGITAISVNFTAVNPAGVGDLRAGPGTVTPVTSVLNFTYSTIANAIVVPVTADQITIKMGAAGANVLMDVNGYYTASTSVNPQLNPLQLALLRWYDALRTGQTIGIGNGPTALAFDGANIWVANYGDGTVQEIPVATGVPKSPITVGSEPRALAFDGANIWVSNFGTLTGSVQKIPVSTGVPGSPISVGFEPAALAFDGSNIWVVNHGDNTVQEIPVATGIPGTPIAVGANPDALTFDGASIWVVNSGDNTVQKIPVATGVPGSPITVGGAPVALAFDGANMWVASGVGTVQQIPVATGVPGNPIIVGSGLDAIAFDGANVWVANGGGTVQKIPVATGVPGSPIAVGVNPSALAFDGANMWVANFSDNTVQKE